MPDTSSPAASLSPDTDAGLPGAVPARKSLHWLSWIFGVALLAAVIVAALHVPQAREFARIAEHAQPWWLALAMVFQVGRMPPWGRSSAASSGLAAIPEYRHCM